MAVNYYGNEFGIVSVVVGDSEFAAINSLGSGVMANANGLTALGNNVIAAVPATAISGVMALREDETSYDETRYNMLTSYFPRISIERVTVHSSSVENRYYEMTGSDTKRIRIQTITYGSAHRLDWYASFEMQEGAQYYQTPNSNAPFGSMSPVSIYGTMPNYYTIGFMYCTDDFGQWGYFEISVGLNNLDEITFSHSTLNSAQNTFMQDFFDGIEPVHEDTDPYAPGGNSEEYSGGDGTFDGNSDIIADSSLPSLTVADTGFVRIYNPTLAQLKTLAQYMWTDSTFLDTIVNHAKQMLENPIESIVSLNLLPCPIPNATAEEVKVLFVPTGVHMNPATTQFVEIDCGSLAIEPYYDSALDYSPYTKIHCFLPYIGQVVLDCDEVMGKTISIKYRIDIVTGMCVAKIFVAGSVMYQFSGHCAISMPLTSADFSQYVSAAIGVAKAVTGIAAGAAGASGVASAMLGTSAPSSTTSKVVNTTRNEKTGRQNISQTSTATSESSGASFGEMTASGVANTVGSVMGSKLSVEHSGGFTGNSGYLGVRRPFVIIERPRMCNPAEYGTYNGYPSMLTLNLGECTGYTKVQEIQLTGLSATNPELSEISQLLKAGVIL